MSDTDSFIREVEEEVRQDRMLRYWKQYGPYVIGTIVAIVLVSALLAWLDRAAEQAAQETGGLLIEASEAELETVEAIRGRIDGEAAVIAELRLAQVAAENGDTERALGIYDALAADGALPRRYSELAALEAVRLIATTAPQDALGALDAMMAPDAVYRLLAQELRAVVRLNTGDAAGAREDMTAILADPTATGETRARVRALLATLPPGE
ncbi:MAG: hypothetical protein AAF074_24020 [Pseudomonadota bacterium]